jgi:hypothetical protein
VSLGSAISIADIVKRREIWDNGYVCSIEADMERKRARYALRSYPAFTWKNWGKPWITYDIRFSKPGVCMQGWCVSMLVILIRFLLAEIWLSLTNSGTKEH